MGMVFGGIDLVITVESVVRAGSSWLRRVEAGLDQVFTLRFCDERLELRGGEGVDETGFGDDEQ